MLRNLILWQPQSARGRVELARMSDAQRQTLIDCGLIGDKLKQNVGQHHIATKFGLSMPVNPKTTFLFDRIDEFYFFF